MEQLTLSFEPGIAQRYRSLLSLVAARIYRAGLDNVARDVDMAPSNLSTALAGDKGRFFGVDKLEVYIEKYHDYEPIYYLVDKYLKDTKSPSKAQVLNQCMSVIQEIQAQMRSLKEG